MTSPVNLHDLPDPQQHLPETAAGRASTGWLDLESRQATIDS
ncbi:MAG: hypothetical protein Q4A28_01440 [Brachymonas sp.]|nr:hypothetical protein [Brachymonas sp.]